MAYVRKHWADYPDTTTPIDADALNNIEDGIEESHNIQLLAVTSTAPSECIEGDKYYNTTTRLIYTATATDTWGEIGETPIKDIFYIVLDEQTTYTYDGTDLISVGGSGGGANIVNEYSESTTESYSANYVNGKVSDLESVGKTVTFNNEWRNAYKPPAGNLSTVIPINNPTRTAPTINITAEIYSYGWKTCTCSIQYYTETEICIELAAPSDVSLTDGNVYLVRFSGSITAN